MRNWGKKLVRDILMERIQSPDGSMFSFSWSRIQSVISFFFFLGFYIKQTWATQNIPDIPEGWIYLIGVSSATYLIAKYSVMRQQQSMFGYGNYGNGPIYNGPNPGIEQPAVETPVPLAMGEAIPGPDGPKEVEVKND